MAKTGGLFVALQKYPVSFQIHCTLTASLNERCTTLSLVSKDGFVSLLSVGDSAFITPFLEDALEFVWTNRTSEELTSEDEFAVLRTNKSIDLFTIIKQDRSFEIKKSRQCNWDSTQSLLSEVGIEISSDTILRLLNLQGCIVTTLIDSFICRIAVTDEGPPEILQHFEIDTPPEDLACVKFCQGFVIVLQKNGIISFYALDKKEKFAIVNTREHLSSKDLHDVPFTSFDVSENLLLLAVCDAVNNIFPICLNIYFAKNPQYLVKGGVISKQRSDVHQLGPSVNEEDCTFLSQYKGIYTDNNRTWRNQLLHYKGIQRTAKCGNDGVGKAPQNSPQQKYKNWYENIEGNNSNHMKLLNHSNMVDNPVCGFMKNRTRSMSNQSRSSVSDKKEYQFQLPGSLCRLTCLTSRDSMWIQSLHVRQSSVVAWYISTKSNTDEAVCTMCIYDLQTGEQQLCEFVESACLVCSPNTNFPNLVITDSTIGVVVNGQQEAFVNKLMTYDSASIADTICRVNQWDRCSIPIHALEVGLRHRQLDTVAFFLKSRENMFTLSRHTSSSVPNISSASATYNIPTSPFRAKMDTFQLEAAVDLLCVTIRDNINSEPQSKQFAEQLLHMTLEFLNHLLRNVTSLAQQQEEEEEGTVDEDLKSSMATLMIYINELRQYLRDVPHWVSNQSSTGKQDATKLNKHYSFYMPEASHFTEGCLQRWNHMKEEEIIRDGILNNSIPLVQCYLKQSSKSSGNLQHIIDIGFSQVYLALLERDLRNSARMLKSMGFNVTQQLRRICLYSPNVYLRDFLVEELKKSGDLTDIELSMVHFVYQLESLYTCRSYDKAKSIAEETKKHYWENIIRLSRIPTMQAKSVMSSLMKTGDIMPPDDMNAESGNYSHIVLEWVRDWDEETRQRILLDRMFNNTDRSFEGFIEPRTRWKYYLSHNLWNPISKWITADPDSICADMLNDMTLCTPYIKNKVLDEMARKGLFASEELSDFDRLLRRLGNCHQLLRHPHILSNNTTMNVEMFHSQFILYCIQHSLPNVLHYYMDFYGLAVTDDHISRLRSEHKSCYWFEMLLFFRYNSRKLGDPNIMFQASLANCRFLFKVNQPTVTSLLEADRPIAAMATLMFAPCNLNEVIGSAENEDERLWKVDGNLLKQSLQSYPKLQAALFPVQTADGITPQDITMYQLLQGNTQFDISKLFRWQSTNNISTPLTDKATELPHFSQPDLVNQYAHKEVLRYTYYLRKARPSFAFVAFVKNLQDTDPAVLKKRTKQAYYRVYTIALQELTQHSISAACVAFIEMLGQDSSALRIDLQSGNLMLRYKKDELTSDQRFDKSTREQKAQEIESNILSDLLSALKQKGSSAERLLRNLESAITGEIEKAAEESTSFAASQYWSLAVLFCQIHKLPYTTVYLEDCAKNDQWLRFLCFVQNHHYPQNQVLELICHFHSPHIREHLQHAVENLQYIPDGKGHLSRNEEQAKRSKDLRAQYLKRVGIAKGDIVGSSTDSDKESEAMHKTDDSTTLVSSDTGSDIPPSDLEARYVAKDLFSIMFTCHNYSHPWRSLLAHSVVLSQPVLAILAACYKEAVMLDCLCVWLLVSMDEVSVAKVAKANDMTTVQWHKWDLGDFSQILDIIVEKGYLSMLVKGFQIFDKDCSLFAFVQFLEAFLVGHDTEKCKKCLKEFYDALLLCRRLGKERHVAKIGHQKWYEETACRLSLTLMKKCTTKYDMNKLLCVLNDSVVTKLYSDIDYAKMNKIFQLFKNEDIDLEMEQFFNPSSHHQEYYKQILDTLQQAHKFELAMEFSDVMGLSTNHIVVQKLSADLSSVQQSGVWQSSEGREAFWYKCHEVFQLHQTSSDFAAQFFKDHAESSSMCVKEKELLLGLAHHWLAKDLMHVQREELQKLEQQIWLCRIQIEVYNAETPSPEDEVMTTNSKEMFKLPLNKKIKPEFGHLGNKELLLEEIYTISKETVPILTALKEKQALDRLIGAQLEAHCISQALSLAKQFKHYNENLAVVMTCLQLAQGRLNTDELDTTMNELLIKGKGRRKSSPWAGTMSRSASFASLSSAQTEYLSRDAEDLVNTMETLSENCKLGKKCCYRIINCFSIGQILNRSYVDIVNQNCFDVLKDVLTSDHMHRFQLAKTYIASSGATDQELAGFLSDAITHSLSVFTGHQDGDMPCQSRDLIFSPMDKKEDFANLLSLCDNPAVLGYRLADTAAYLASSFPEDPNKVLAMEVELLVRSHQCHTLCCNMEGIASILRTCRVRSIKLASVEEYPLLVRMLTGVGRYSEMTYIIDIIIKAQRFELLFIKGKKDDKLKVALLDYLKKYYPDDKDIFTMMALKFNMYREIAELLQSDAKRFLKELKEQFKNMEANPDLQEKLQRILNLFSDAADSYVKEGCLRHAESCVKKARLIALQIHLLSTRTKVINLSQREVVFFVATHPKFYEALIVCEAYGKHVEWSSAVYNNVVVDGDLHYLEDFRMHQEISTTLFSEVAGRYRLESSKTSQITSNMKKLLSYCRDVQLSYKLATELGFNDVAMTLLEGSAGAFLRDVA